MTSPSGPCGCVESRVTLLSSFSDEAAVADSGERPSDLDRGTAMVGLGGSWATRGLRRRSVEYTHQDERPP